LKRLLLVTLLAGGLTFAGPSQAHAAPVGPSQGLWKWLTRVWEEGIAVVWGQPGTGSSIPEKAGACVDPNGCANSTVTPTGQQCRTHDEAGACVDPNG
jgi:hypothetical protein